LSRRSETNLILNIKDSSLLTSLLLGLHLGAMAMLMAVPVVWPVRLMLWLLLGGSLYRSLRVHAWRQGPSAIVAVEMDSEGMVSARFDGSDAWLPCQISDRFVHPWVTLLSLKFENRRWPVSLAIAVDAVEAEAFRRWRVALKFRGLPA
jgi:hypothetical protein